jgi:hypothetical protein
MQLTIDKKRISQTIAELPENTTVAEAIEQLMLLHKIEVGLDQQGGQSHDQVKQHFQARRRDRNA